MRKPLQPFRAVLHEKRSIRRLVPAGRIGRELLEQGLSVILKEKPAANLIGYRRIKQ